MSFCDRCYVGDGFCSLHPRPVQPGPPNPGAYAFMLATLQVVREELDDRADIRDTEGGPAPNWAMSLLRVVDEAIAKATKT